MNIGLENVRQARWSGQNRSISFDFVGCVRPLYCIYSAWNDFARGGNGMLQLLLERFGAELFDNRLNDRIVIGDHHGG